MIDDRPRFSMLKYILFNQKQQKVKQEYKIKRKKEKQITGNDQPIVQLQKCIINRDKKSLEKNDKIRQKNQPDVSHQQIIEAKCYHIFSQIAICIYLQVVITNKIRNQEPTLEAQIKNQKLKECLSDV